MVYLNRMKKEAIAKRHAAPRPGPRRVASHSARKATTLRLDPPLQKGLLLLQGVLKKPLNRLVNEAVQGFLEKRVAEVESDLQQVLTRLRRYRRSDPNFEKAIAQFVDAEAALVSEDPIEGRTQSKAGPAQTMVQELLRGELGRR